MNGVGSCGLSGSDQAVVERHDDRGRAIADLELVEDVADVGLDRGFGDHQLVSDLLVRQPETVTVRFSYSGTGSPPKVVDQLEARIQQATGEQVTVRTVYTEYNSTNVTNTSNVTDANTSNSTASITSTRLALGGATNSGPQRWLRPQ